MSFYGSRKNSTSERTQRNRSSLRKDSTDRSEMNANGNNNNEVSRGLESYISNYTKSAESSHRSSVSRMPGGLRMKSNLVGSMTATFEQLKTKDSLPPPSPSALKSSSYSRVEGAITIGQKAGNGSNLENGNSTVHAPKTSTSGTTKLENGLETKTELDDNENSERIPSQKAPKPSSSARRGKQQREKRMLRQKRRSTGVVRLKGSDDEDEEKAKENTQNPEAKEEDTSRKSETEKNTLSNELSPPSSANSLRVDNENKLKPYDVSESSILKKSSTSSSTLLSPSQPDNVFLSGDSAPQSPVVPVLNSSRRRGKRTPEKTQLESDDKYEIEELRKKLAAAETTIGKLSNEIEDMETDIKKLAEENHKLKHENKLLEDENTSMLMVLKQLRSSKE